MALPIRWSHKAARQLESIIEYIGEDSPRYAAIFAKRLVQTIRVIPELPHAGRMVPEFADPELRERILQGYRIVYRISPHAIEIVAICHGSRLLHNAIEEPDK
jgi:toxin ParE1/3/4